MSATRGQHREWRNWSGIEACSPVEVVTPPSVEALQGADLIAYESYAYAIEVFKNGPNAKPNPHFQEFMWRDLSGAVMMNREMIQEVADAVRAKMKR